MNFEEGIINTYRSAGLTKYQAKVYIALLSYGAMRSGEIASKVEIPSQRIHEVLTSLADFGLIAVILPRPARYEAYDPKIGWKQYIVRETDKLAKKASTLSAQIPILVETSKVIPKRCLEKRVFPFKPLMGIKSIKPSWRSLIASAKSDVLIFASDKDWIETDMGVFKYRQSSGVKIRILAKDAGVVKKLESQNINAKTADIDINGVVIDGKDVFLSEKMLPTSRYSAEGGSCQAIQISQSTSASAFTTFFNSLWSFSGQPAAT